MNYQKNRNNNAVANYGKLLTLSSKERSFELLSRYLRHNINKMLDSHELVK